MGNTTTRENFQAVTSLNQAVGGRPIPCPPGTYGETTGLSSNQCTGKCRAGYYCTQASPSPTQFDCPQGYYCLEGTGDPLSQNRPAACAAGTTSGLRATSCTACDDGTSSIPGGQCTPCSANTYSVNLCGALSQAAAAEAAAAAGAVPPATISPVGPASTAPAGLQMWYDGNDPSATGSTPQDGVSISSWKDKSGNGYHAATAGGPPARVNVQNGLSAMQFSSSSRASVTYPASPNLFGTVFQVFVVCKSTNGVDDGVSTPMSLGVTSQFDPWNQSRYLNDHRRKVQSPNSLYNRNISLFGALVNQGSSTYYKEWLNGGQVITFLEGPAENFDRTTNTNTFYIAQRGDGATRWQGYIYEIAAYNVELSTADREKVEGYLASKWGFSLVDSHPYRTTPSPITMLTSPPFKPSGLTAVTSTEGIAVTWEGGGGGTSYTITATSIIQAFTATVTGRNLTTGIVAGVVPGYTYAIVVMAINQFGSTSSDSIMFAIPNITVNTLAGSTRTTTAALDGLNGAAFIHQPTSIVVDSCGSLFVVENGNHYIRKIYLQRDASSSGSGSSTLYPMPNIVTTFAGTGSSGLVNTGTNTRASFNSPLGLAIDSADTLYVADTSNHCIRKITPQGVVTTLAGSGNEGSSNGTGTAASFRRPTGIAVDSTGNVYVTDRDNHLIRKITPQGVVSTLAGSGSSGSVDAAGINASFNTPFGITTDSTGNVFVADYGNHTIRRITPTGVVTTIAGKAGSTGTTNGVGACARFNSPAAIAFDSNGSLYVAERNSNVVRKITFTVPSSNSATSALCAVSDTSVIATVTSIAGTGQAGYANGMGLASQFNSPQGLCFSSTGVLYVADANNNLIRSITIRPTPAKPQPLSCATLCKPCCPGTLSPMGASSCSPYPGYIINSSRIPYNVNRGFYQNDTNGVWSGYFTSSFPAGLTANAVIDGTGLFSSCTLHLFPGWIAFGYLNKNPISKMVLDLTPYTGSSTIRATTYVLVILSQSEVTYTTGSATGSLGSRQSSVSVSVPNIISRGSGLPSALPLFVCENLSPSC